MSITIEQIVQETRAHAEQDPTFGLMPEDACRYFDESSASPVCIVGHALYDLHVDVPTLIRLDHATGFGGSTAIDSTDALAALGIEEPERKSDDWYRLRWLSTVQQEQDGGASWAEAVEYADERLREENPQHALLGYEATRRNEW